MKKWVVTKKCYANEFVFVEANSEEEAIAKAKKGGIDEQCLSKLEFGGYRDTEFWQVEKLNTENKPTRVGTHDEELLLEKQHGENEKL